MERPGRGLQSNLKVRVWDLCVAVLPLPSSPTKCGVESERNASLRVRTWLWYICSHTSVIPDDQSTTK